MGHFDYFDSCNVRHTYSYLLALHSISLQYSFSNKLMLNVKPLLSSNDSKKQQKGT